MIDPFNARSAVYTPRDTSMWQQEYWNIANSADAIPTGKSPVNVHSALDNLRQLFNFTKWHLSAYTAKHNEIVRADPGVSGAFTVKLPAIIEGVSSWVGFKRWTSGTNVLTIQRGDGTTDKLNTLGNSSIEFNDVAGGLLLVNDGKANGTWYEWLKWDGT